MNKYTVFLQLECCGSTGPEDYQDSAFNNETSPETTLPPGYDVPDSCCTEYSGDPLNGQDKTMCLDAISSGDTSLYYSEVRTVNSRQALHCKS